MDCSVATSDDPPVVLGQMPVAWVEAMGPKVLRPGRLLKFVVQEPCGADLKYVGPGNQRRGRADAFSKILFQYLARTKPTSIEELIAAAPQP
ncbi:uncharacterized protein HaLaN_26779, partial [Haematococcus lacustris]